MNKRIKAALTAVLVTASALPMIPSAAEAADDEYLVRDKWGYCKSANYVESDHFVIFYGNNDTTGHVNAEFLRRNLEDYEKLWKCYSEYLGMENMNVDVNGRSSQKYKTNVYLTCTGLPEFQEGWAFMSAEDGYGIEIISPDAMLDDLTIAHEFGHVVTMQQKAWVDQDITGAWWEPLANWFREMYISSPYYTGNVKTCWFEPYIRNLSLTLPHGRNYYEVWPFLVYLSYNPDNLPGLGIDCVKRIISEAKPGEYPFDTITRLFGTDEQTVFGHYSKRMATFDFGAKQAYQEEFNKKMKEQPFYSNLYYTYPEADAADNTVYTVPQEEAPMQAGINIIPLTVTGGDITISFNGISDDPNAAWQACIVTVDSSGKETYSDLFGSGDTMTASASGAASAYLTVAAMPKELYKVNAFHKEKESPYKTGNERRRYPYTISLSGAAINYVNTYRKGSGHAHPNGGGWVSDSAKVSDSVYVGKNATVSGNAELTGNVRVEDHAVVANGVKASGNAVISGHAIVDGGGWVYDNDWKYGSVVLSGNAVIGDSAVVTNSCTVSDNAKVLQKAYLADAVSVSDNAVVKGMAYVYGKSSFSGTAILDGDYCNEQTKDSGVGYGWLDDNGWKNTSDGYIASYDFSDAGTNWTKDKYAATDMMIKGAVAESERTSAKGVLSFDRSGGYAVMEDSLLRTDDIQISFGVLWKGGAAGQELFRFGDDKAYMSFTPANSQGSAELVFTDGNRTEKLTASSPLTKGEWSKVTVRIIGGQAELLINGKSAANGSFTLTPKAVLSASETDSCIVGNGFNGALDYIGFTYKKTDEPNVTYSGREEAVESILGDVNADGETGVADLLLLNKWLLGTKDTTLADWKAGDLDGNNKLDTFDLCLMRKLMVR